MNYSMNNDINQNNQPDKVAFALLCTYLALFLVGSHAFNEVVLALFALMLVTVIVTYRVVRIDRNIAPLIILILYAFLSILWSSDKSAAFSEAFSILKCFGLTWAITMLCNSRKRIVQVLLFFVVGCIVLDAYCVYRVGISGLAQLAEDELRLGTGTISINGNEVAHNNAIAAVIIMFLVEEFKNNKWYLLLFPVVAIVLLTGSRAGIIVLAFGLLVSILLYNRTHKLFKIVGISLFLMMLLYVASYYGLLGTAIKRFTSMMNVLTGIGHQEGSTTLRIQLIVLGFQLFLKNPIFGYGCGQFKTLALKNIGVAMSPHNTYTQILVSFGLIGFLLWYGTYFKILKSALKRRKDNLAILIIIICICWLVCDVLSHSLIKKTSYFILGIGLSFLNLEYEESELS